MAADPLVPPPDLLKKMDEAIGIIRILSGRTAAGEDFYAYVSVRPSMYEEFSRKVDNGESMIVESYGKVLHKGFGLQPSDDVKRYMEDQYGIDPNFAANLADAMKDELLKRQQEKK